jgi:hypothetical protein
MSASRSYLKVSFAPIHLSFGKLPGDVSRNNQCRSSSPELSAKTTRCLPRFALEYHRGQFRRTEASTAADLVGATRVAPIRLSILGKKIRTTLGYICFALLAQLNRSAEIRTVECVPICPETISEKSLRRAPVGKTRRQRPSIGISYTGSPLCLHQRRTRPMAGPDPCRRHRSPSQKLSATAVRPFIIIISLVIWRDEG